MTEVGREIWVGEAAAGSCTFTATSPESPSYVVARFLTLRKGMRYIRCFKLPNFGVFCYAAMCNECNINLYMSYNFRPTLKINCEVGEKLDTIIPKLNKRVNR